LYRDVQIYKVEPMRLGVASQGFVNLGELGDREQSRSYAITFVTNIDLVKAAGVRFLCADRHFRNISGVDGNTPRYDFCARKRPDRSGGRSAIVWGGESLARSARFLGIDVLVDILDFL